MNINPKNWSDIKALRRSTGATYIRAVWNDSTFLAGFGDIKTVMEHPYSKGVLSRYYLIDNNGKLISKNVFEQYVPQPGGLKMMGDFNETKRHTLFAISNKKHFFSAWSEDFLINEFDPKGKYLRAFYYPYKKVKLNRDSLMQNLHNPRKRQTF